ncbi:MAG TPA: tetratricopeptide repeat protein [Chitinophagales bacterium]
MKFLKSPYFLVAIFVVVGVCVYLFVPTVKKKDNASAASEMSASSSEKNTGFDFEAYLKKVNANVTNQDTLKLMEDWQKSENYDALALLYHQKGESVAEAHFTELAARKTGNLAQLEHAGDLFEATSAISNSDEMKAYMIDRAVASYNQVFAVDTANVPLKMKLAATFIEQGTNPMQGIGMLLDIVKKDPKNADAQLMLGKFAIMSGQFEKAIERLEKVISLRPRSNDALFLLAIAYENNGNKNKALEILERCKKQEQNPDLKKEIESYIERLKQS